MKKSLRFASAALAVALAASCAAPALPPTAALPESETVYTLYDERR